MKNFRSTIIGFAVLVVLLSAGAAQSLAGSNTVTSDDIVDFSIVANDIKTAAIGGRPIVDNSITGADVNESTLDLPQVLTTAVLSAGSKQFGSGTPSLTDTGDYSVDYGFALTSCTAQVTPGFHAVNPDTTSTDLSTIAVVGSPENDRVTVQIRDNAGVAKNSAFFLTVSCP